MISAAIIALGALSYHVRGGFLGKYIPGGDLLPRLQWCLYVAVVEAALIPYLEPLSTAMLAFLPALVLTYAGLMIPHGWAMTDDWTSRFGMGAVMTGRLALSLSPVAWALHDPTVMVWALMGFLCGFPYWLGYRLNLNLPELHPTEIGEWGTGAVVGAALVLAVG